MVVGLRLGLRRPESRNTESGGSEYRGLECNKHLTALLHRQALFHPEQYYLSTKTIGILCLLLLSTIGLGHIHVSTGPNTTRRDNERRVDCSFFSTNSIKQNKLYRSVPRNYRIIVVGVTLVCHWVDFLQIFPLSRKEKYSHHKP
jgi:hypothetical protein